MSESSKSEGLVRKEIREKVNVLEPETGPEGGGHCCLLPACSLFLVPSPGLSWEGLLPWSPLYPATRPIPTQTWPWVVRGDG